MSDLAAPAGDATTAALPQANPSPPQPAPDASPNVATPGAVESNAQDGSGAGEPQAANPQGEQGDEAEKARKERVRQTAQERFDELTALRRAAERRAVAAEARAAELARQLQPPGQFATLEEQEAFNVRKAVREERIDDLRNEAESAQAEAWESVKAAAAAKAEAAAERMPGLVEKLRALPELSAASVKFIAESEKGAEVAYHLAHNPAEASRIHRLHPLDQGIELARLEARLSVAPPVRKLSTAPNPPPTVTGNPSAASKTTEELSVAEMQTAFKKRGLIR